MFNKIIKIIKNIITSSLLIYAFDSFSLSLNCLVSLNFLTILIVSLFGILGLLGIVVLSFFI